MAQIAVAPMFGADAQVGGLGSLVSREGSANLDFHRMLTVLVTAKDECVSAFTIFAGIFDPLPTKLPSTIILATNLT